MRLTAIRLLMIGAVLVIMPGCQSGPRWAWWKHEKAGDTSLVARSATPDLPSAQSAPQAIASAGMEPAAPPSTANLATAAPQPGGALPALPATIANAPLANYPAINGLNNNMPATPTGAPASIAAMPPQVTAASVPPSGPYDPNGYQPSAELPAASPIAAVSSAGADRYGISAAIAPNIAPSSMPPSSLASGDQNGASVTDRYSSSPANGATAPLTTAAASAPTTAETAPPAISPAAPAPANVQLSSTPGQYRPGGTSSYAGVSTTQPIEVATRPAPPASASLPATTAAPIGNSVPWSPPATTAPTGAGTRTY